MQLHHEVTLDDGVRAKQAISARWDQSSTLVCTTTACVARERGGRDNSCKVKLAATGQVTSTCIATEPY